MNEPKAARYHRLRRRLAVASVLASVLFLAALVASGGSVWLREAAARLTAPLGGAPWLVVAAYIALLALAHELLLFPFVVLQGYVLERSFGLSRQGVRGWLADHVKAFGVGLILALLAGSIAYWTLRAWPATWWLATAAALGLATIGLAHVAPVLLLPLFYEFKPVEREALKARLLNLARRAGTRVLGVFEWRLGDKTRKANAALVGINQTRRILLSDTLLAEYSDEEIEVVLAHEFAHHVHGDIWKGVAFEMGLTLAGCYAAHVALGRLTPLAGLDGPADVAGLPILLLSVGAVSLACVPLANALSRRHERRADRYALDATRNPEAFVSAMRRLSSQNLAEERPTRLTRLLFHTHPPIDERVGDARKWEGERTATAPPR
jgi:STE24 endopeptidase